MAHEPLPPILMVRSFLTVVSAFVLFVINFLLIAAVLGYFFFPEYLEFFLETDPGVQQEIMENRPEDAISRPMFIAMLVLNFISCSLLGVYVFWTAPFSHFAHVIFLAGLLFVYFLQMANGDPVGKKQMTMIYLFVFPTAVLIGGKLADNRARRRYLADRVEAEQDVDSESHDD